MPEANEDGDKHLYAGKHVNSVQKKPIQLRT